MDLPNPKELKKLADMCRKAGIKHFKSDKFEFTLTDEVPLSQYKLNKAKTVQTPAGSAYDPATFQSDALAEDELLFWSTGVAPEQGNE